MSSPFENKEIIFLDSLTGISNKVKSLLKNNVIFIVNEDIDTDKMWSKIDKKYHRYIFMKRELNLDLFNCPMVPKQIVCKEHHRNKNMYPLISTKDVVVRFLGAEIGDVIKTVHDGKIYYRMVF